MEREISQRELRNDSGKIMRAVKKGESFIVTSNGEPVARLSPLHDRHFVPAEVLLEAFKGAPKIDYQQFRADLDALADPSPWRDD
ncbi:type II toxin-antitoxin system Phd/YefM family antitoxin [Candidatus Poriferisodalis sp.]|uniref:type II toxin-antitoxin system Phd/YefM family antitoxin n=1 Tax=Candidatus Poriferisodalis sp. TaxID=3101277 RepID=UPI003C6FF442